jgi:GNAT superfamily N-acetyltransferase
VIRVARAADWPAIRELCCRTGDGGSPVAPGRWPFFAELWIGPYQRLLPGWTHVAETPAELAGYLTGCPDTRAFEQARAFRVTLALLARVALGRYGWTVDTRRFVRQAFGLARPAEAAFPPALVETLRRDYPAHLHMNVAAGARGRGIGGALLEAYLDALRERGVPGVHLFCGAGPLGFYGRHGFAVLGRLELADGFRVHACARLV